MEVNSITRDCAQTLLRWNSSLKLDDHVKKVLTEIAETRIVPKTKNPLVEVSYTDFDDTHGDLEIEEVITLREYLCKIYGEELNTICIERSYGPGCWSVESKVSEWEADWVLNSFRRETKYGYWNLEKYYEDFDFVKDVDRFMEAHGPFDPENESLPTKQDIQNFVSSLKSH